MQCIGLGWAVLCSAVHGEHSKHSARGSRFSNYMKSPKRNIIQVFVQMLTYECMHARHIHKVTRSCRFDCMLFVLITMLLALASFINDKEHIFSRRVHLFWLHFAFFIVIIFYEHQQQQRTKTKTTSEEEEKKMYKSNLFLNTQSLYEMMGF